MEPQIMQPSDESTGTDEPTGPDAVDADLDALDAGGSAEAVNKPDPEGDEATLNPGDSDFTSGSGLFSGDETADSGGGGGGGGGGSGVGGGDDDDNDDGGSDPFDFDDTAEGSDLSGLATAVNEGAARAAVTGLDPDEHDKDSLETEFSETFAAFKLGHFASKVADEYVFTNADDEVDPIWGLLATMMLCSAFALWSRPDSEEQISRIKDAIGGIADGEGGDE